ncbi:RadC family protein [Desulfocucumis palustris]|nr:DNA repair protein RadC [Desulfocucumis palustris]
MDYPIFHSLPLKDLLGLIIRENSEDATGHLLQQYPSLQELAQITLEELTVIPGVGLASARIMMACIELAKRFSTPLPERTAIKSPQDVYTYLADMRYLDREHFKALHLNTKNQVTVTETISIGTLNSSVVHPRELFKSAVRKSSAALILAHNHPSSDCTPSMEDIDVTKRLVEAGNIIGIEILDHVVVGFSGFLSFKEKGLL